MAFIPVTNAAEAHMLHTWDGQAVENTLWFTNADEWGETALDALAGSLNTIWLNAMVPLMSEEITYNGCEIIDMREQDGVSGSAQPASPTPGGMSTGSQANNVTVTVSFRTGRRGRSYRGGNKWLTMPKTEIAGNIVSAIYLASIKTAYELLLGDGAVEPGWRFCVASRQHNKAPRNPGIATPVREIVFADDIADSCRRRLPGRGQ